MHRILFIDSVHPLICEELTRHGYQCDQFPNFSRRDFQAIIGDYTGIIVRSKIRLDERFLSKALKLRFIGRVGAGMENIDVQYAENRGIICLNSPEGNRDAVGEHATGMLLSLLNHMNRADRQVRRGFWLREENTGLEIQGKTLGIIGYGNMGSAFAQRLKGFDANVIAYDKYKTGYSDGNVRETTLDEIFNTTDILSLHVPLTNETRYMFNKQWIDRMGKPFFLVNTARGGVVCTIDLVEGLRNGKILGAALDVLEYEESSFEKLSDKLPPELKYLTEADNVILTPHIAGWTVESQEKLARVLVDKIIKALPAITI